MDDDCKDLYTGGLIKRYTKRPVSVEHVTITDWAVWYDCETKSYVKPLRLIKAWVTLSFTHIFTKLRIT